MPREHQCKYRDYRKLLASIEKTINEKRNKANKWKGYYILRGKDIVRILSTNQKENRVIIKICDSGTKEHMEYDTAHLYLKPIFKIGDAAKALQRQS